MPVPRRILLIDDSPLVLAVTRSALESAGYEVDVATDIATFETYRNAHTPDLIVVDVQMPEAFGDDLAATLRGVYGVETPILLLSSLPEQELATRSAEAEVAGFVSKNRGIEELVARVKTMLEDA
jgi:DNA-binding response OmpR family regulator